MPSVVLRGVKRLVPATLAGRVFALQLASAGAAAALLALVGAQLLARLETEQAAERAGVALHGQLVDFAAGAATAAPGDGLRIEPAEARDGPQQALPRWPGPAPLQLVLRWDSGGLLPLALDDLAAERDGRAYAVALSRRLAQATRAAQLVATAGDGRRLVLAAPALWRNRHSPLLLPLLAGAGLVALVLLLRAASRRLARPFHRLAAEIEQRGGEVRQAPLAEAGPLEARALARADNQLRGRLAALMAEQTRMLAAISHDLRTPGTRLRLRAEGVAEPGVREAMLRDLDEMDAMLDEVLDFLSRELREEEVKTVDLGALLQSICDDYADLGAPVSYADPPPLTFHAAGTLFAPPPSAGPVQVFAHERKVRLACRPVALRRAIANLIDNALKYGRCAAVRLDAGAEQVRIAVEDQGPGIPPEEMEKVFLPLYRIESSRQRSTGGIGLGLAIVRSAIAAHRGQVELRNREAGGLCVLVTLPREA